MSTSCSVAACDRQAIARNMCGTHYARSRRGKPLNTPIETKQPGRLCEITGCGRKYAAKGLCTTHLERRRKGIPLNRPIRPVLTTDDLHQRLRHYSPEGPPDECWEWTRCTNKGYGMIAIGDGKLRGAHIVAWELANNRTLPSGMVIRHTCDNPPCTNPAHLVLGTHADNVADRVEHGKPNKGTDNAGAKVTEADVRTIRRLAHCGVAQRIIAERFGIKQANVSAIVLRKTWKHL